MLRALALCLLLALAACQSTGSDGKVDALASVTDDKTDVATAEEPAVVGLAETEEADAAAATPVTAPVAADANTTAAVDPAPASAPTKTSDAVLNGVQAIARTYSQGGRDKALRDVLACYQRVQGRSASIAAAKVCAAQDFVVSNAVTDAYKAAGRVAKRDRTVLVAERVAERIGALMQLKGMSQSQFNTFGLYLHQVAKPAFDRARA